MSIKNNQMADSLKQQRDQILSDLDSQATNPFRLITESQQFMDVMLNDVNAANFVSGQNPNNQTWRRIVVRLCFSAIDALCSDAKRFVYCFLKYGSIVPSRKDLKYITGIDENGGKFSPFKPTLEENIKYIAGRLTTLSTRSWNIGEQSSEWQAFRTSVSVRHRLTHPKCLEDLAISDIEYNRVADGLLWLQSGLNKIISGIAPKQPNQ